MKLKKIWIHAFMIVIALLVVGCQPAAEGDGDTGDTGDGGDSAEVVTITIWDFGGSEFQFMDDSAIPEFEAKFPNIKVEHVGVLEDEMGLKLETAIAAGEVPDIAIFVPNRVHAAGHTLALDDFMARDGIARDDYCSLFESWNVFTGGKVEDKVVSLPMDAAIWAMAYNKDLFEEAGLPELGTADVITFDEWLEYSRAINKPAENLEDRVWGSNMFWPIFNSMNNYMSTPYVLGDDGRTCEGNANSADWQHAWDVLYTAYDEDVTTESAGVLLQDVEEDMFLQGKMGMTYGTLGDVVVARAGGLNVGLTGQPVVSPGWEGNVGGWDTAYSIMAATEHPEESWEFLKFLSTEALASIPLGTDMLAAEGGGLPGLPCYLPLLEEGDIAEMIASDPLVADAAALMARVQTPPRTADIWGSVDPFWGIFDMVDSEGMDVETAVNTATATCQEITDQLWDTLDSIGG
jgi:ABC-type glycerol-3-phosphate transport system substrate-binding protein